MFNAPKMTDAGKALYFDNMAGTQVVFTTIKLGSGNISGPISQMSDLVDPVITIEAEIKSISGQYVEISGYFSNEQLTDGFYWKEIGVFAKNPDYPNDRSKDILFCYQNAYDTADYIPVASVETVEKSITIPVIIGDANSVSCTLDKSKIYVTLKDFEEGLEKKAPSIHASQHGSGGSDPITPGSIGAAAASHGTHVSYSTANPEMDGAATPGTSASVARSDHKHPTDTSRAAVNHGTHVSYSAANPEMDGAATPGASASVARSDHKHPTDTSRAPSIHASQHGSGGSDPITPASIGAAAASHTHAAGDVASGTFAAARIPNLAASKITSGTFNAARIPTLDVSKISGAFPTGTQGAVNCDSLKDGCWTISDAATNGPKATACVIYHKTWDSNFATQLAICADRTVYSRIRSSGAWQPWTILINSVGGTIDGGLVVKSSAQIDGGLSVGTTLKVSGSVDAKTDQPIEIGKYIDFHSGASDSSDYITRIELDAGTGDLIIRNSVASAKGGALLTTGKVIALYNVSVTLTSGAVKYSNSNIKQTSICFVQRRSGGVGNNTPFSVSSGNGYLSIIADSSVSGAMNVNILIINP